eukprot:742253-Pyramimonas_sp.AAC.1
MASALKSAVCGPPSSEGLHKAVAPRLWAHLDAALDVSPGNFANRTGTAWEEMEETSGEITDK